MIAQSSTAAGIPGFRHPGAGVARWASDRHSTGLRRGLQISLGIVWLIDAALQFQPFMFSRGFFTQVIAPAQAGNPAVLAGPALLAGRLVAATQPVSDTIFATVQLALGLTLLWRPTVKAGLAGSVAWGLLVWWLGEGLGGVLAGARLLVGAPGAAVLYALLAALIWPAGRAAQRSWESAPGWPGLPATAGEPATAEPGSIAAGSVPAGSVAAEGLLRRRGALLAWFVLWASSVYLVLEPANRAPRSLQAAIAAQASGEPGFLASIDHQAAAIAGTQGLAAAVVISLIAAFVGCAVFFSRLTRPGLILAVLFALAIWIVGENFGGILTGRGTDPNSGPLLVLLAIAYWPASKPAARQASRGRDS